MARGHRVSEVPELPLVLGGENLNKLAQTKKAYELLERFGLSEDVDKAKESKSIRRGSGKQRNRRYVSRLGPLLVHANSTAPLLKAVRNLPGVDTCYVDDLNLLQLAPGGHMGRLVIWTEEAFAKLDRLFGESLGAKAELKSGFSLARPNMANADVSRIINSDEVQKVVRAAKPRNTVTLRKKNPLKNLGVMIKLNPYAPSRIRAEIRAQEASKKAKAEKKKAKPVEGATTPKQKREFVAKLLQ
jgi:large subunit ribosomal protein L4e